MTEGLHAKSSADPLGKSWSFVDEPHYSVSYESDSILGTISRTVEMDDGARRVSSLTMLGGMNKQGDGIVGLHDMTWLRTTKKPPTPSPIQTLRICDLFSGCGGITLGVQEACRAMEIQMEAVLAWDILEGARRVYERNFDPEFSRGDPIEHVIDGELGQEITESESRLLEEIGPIDMVVGGPPCQGNSDLNNHSRRTDEKNLLYLRMTRFIEIVRPRIAIIENVLTVRRAQAKVVQRTVEFLHSLGYGVDQGALRAMDIGVPQDRRRHFTVAVLGKPFAFASLERARVEQPRSVMWGIEDLIGLEKASTFDTPASHQIQNRERISWLFGENWEDWEVEAFNVSGDPKNPEAYNLPDHRRPKCHQDGHNYPAVYGRMFPDLPAPTITTGFGSTGQGRFVHPFEQRSLTPHEAARVQSFPDFFDFSTEEGRVSLQTLIGNAVPPMLAEHIALSLLARFNRPS